MPWWWSGCNHWCAPGCGWFGGWYPVLGETIIIENPIVVPAGGYVPLPINGIDPGVGPGAGPGTGPGAGPGTGPGLDPAAGNDPAVGPGAANSDPAAEPKAQFKRFLKVKNDSGENLKVFVQFVVKTEDGDGVWVPGMPGTEQAFSFDLANGEEQFVEFNGKKVASPVVRIWGVSAKGQFLQYRDSDLWLVPETDQMGQHVYLSNDVRTFTFAFPRPE
jgi:hypothetical protein